MKGIKMIALVASLLAPASAYGQTAPSAAQPVETTAKAVRTPPAKPAEPRLDAEPAKPLAAADQQCTCSEWRNWVTMECVKYDKDNNCLETRSTTHRECVAYRCQ